MENKLDLLTKKLYDEGVSKAEKEAKAIIAKAQEDAKQIIEKAEQSARDIEVKAGEVAESLKRKAESEMTLSARQALTSLRQEITNILSDSVSADMAKKGFEDKSFVRELLVAVVKKWDTTDGNIDLEVILSEKEQKDFKDFINEKYKELLDKGVEVKVGEEQDAFILQPHDGRYKLIFSEELFNSFFNRYIKTLTKEILFK